MKHYGDLMQAKLFDRLLKLDLLALNREAFVFQLIRNVTGRNRTVQRAGFRCLTDDDELVTVNFVGMGLGFAAQFSVPRLECSALRFKLSEVRFVRTQCFALRQQEVAAIAVLYRDDFAHVAELVDTF